MTAITSNNSDTSVGKRRAFAIWEVQGNSYRMKLTTSAICELEDKFKTNIMNLIGDEKNIPPLSNMLIIVHAAIKDYHHGIKLEDIKMLYDNYISEGGSLVSFFIDVFMPIYQVSGFFTESLEGKMDEQRAKAKQEIL